MKVIFKAAQKIGGRSYSKGEQSVPDSLAHNLGFKSLVSKGAVQMIPRDAAAQKVQLSKDAKALYKAKAARLAAKAAKASKSAQAAPSAFKDPSSAAGANQPLPKPSQPVSAGVRKAPAIAPGEK